MATSDEWNRVGYTGNPVTGNPAALERVTKELWDLGDLAGRVSRGLDTLLAKAEDGGFEGRTADALRTYVKDELKTYMANINRSFEMAADATARYARALGDGQDRAENAADTVAALERVGGQPLPDDDPEVIRARGELEAEQQTVQTEAKILEDALYEATRLVSAPVRKPKKKSFWQRFVSTFFKVLEIVAMVLTIVAAIVGGPLGLVAFALGAVLFVKALVDYAMGNGNALSLGLAFLGILFPSTKGLTTFGGLLRLGSSGAKALGGALAASGRLLFRGGRLLLTSPGRLLSLAGQGLVRFGSGLAGRAGSGFMALPRVLSRTPAMLGSAMRFMGRFTRGTFRQGWFALSRDFYQSTAFVTGNMATKLGVFAVMGLGRLTATALLPMRYSEIARFGYRGAARMGFINRGLHFTPKGSGIVTRTGSFSGDLLNLSGRGFDRSGTLRPFDGLGTDKLVVPGTPAFNDTLDELADIAVAPVTTPRTPGFSSLPGPTPVRMPSRLGDLGGRLGGFDGLDDLGVRLGGFDGLDTVGLPVGTAPGGQRLALLTPVSDRLGLLDPMGGRLLDPVNGRLGDDLLPPPTALDELRDLDALTGMERTPAGVLRPFDDLARLSVDGKLGGLTENQVRQVLNGEIDLVRVTPDGVVLRIGKTDPIDVRVGLKEGVTVEVLGPADPRVPTWTTTKGAESLDDLGIDLDDLTRLLPDTGDASRTARELLGLGPARTDVPAPVATKPFTALTLREIVTGGATGKLATERFETWLRTQSAQLQLDTVGRRLGELDALTDVPPLTRARAELDLSAARLDLDQSRIAFDRLGMNLDTVRRDIVVMTARFDGPAGVMPTGELRLLNDLGLPTGQWITMEPGQNITWVLRTDAGIVPDVEVRMVDGGFTVTGPDGVVTRFGADGRPLPGEGTSGIVGEGTPRTTAFDFQGLSLDDQLQLRLLDGLDPSGTKAFDGLGSPNGLAPNGLGSPGGLDPLGRVDPLGDLGSRLGDLGHLSDDLGHLSDGFRFDRFDAPAPRTDTVAVDPADLTGVTGFRTEWQRTPLENGGFRLADPTGDLRLVFDASGARQFTDIRLPAGDNFVRFDGDAGPGSLPRIVGEDGVTLPGGASVEPVRGALGVVTGVRVESVDGAWIGRFDLDGTRLSEQLTLSGPVGGPLTGSRLGTTFTHLSGGAPSVTYRLTVPGLTDGAFDVVRLDGALAQRLPGGFAVTDTATGARFAFDRGGRFVELPVDGAPASRLDTFGTTVPDTDVRLVTALDGLDGLDGLGANPAERLPLTSVPGPGVLDDVASDVVGPLPTGERVSLEDLAAPAQPHAAPAPPAPPRVAPPPPAPP
ncbi:hypothetical protein P1P70_34670, partial [Streptomyces sp. MB09-02B]|nr:hypothetical protein [Streptomyces sp. MB09-02B]